MIIMILAQLAEDLAAIASKDLTRFAAFGATEVPDL